MQCGLVGERAGQECFIAPRVIAQAHVLEPFLPRCIQIANQADLIQCRGRGRHGLHTGRNGKIGIHADSIDVGAADVMYQKVYLWNPTDLSCAGEGLRAAVDAQLAVNVVEMALDRARGDNELRGNLFIR